MAPIAGRREASPNHDLGGDVDTAWRHPVQPNQRRLEIIVKWSPQILLQLNRKKKKLSPKPAYIKQKNV